MDFIKDFYLPKGFLRGLGSLEGFCQRFFVVLKTFLENKRKVKGKIDWLKGKSSL